MQPARFAVIVLFLVAACGSGALPCPATCATGCGSNGRCMDCVPLPGLDVCKGSEVVTCNPDGTFGPSLEQCDPTLGCSAGACVAPPMSTCTAGPCCECTGGTCQLKPDGAYCGGGAVCHAGSCCAGCWNGTTCVDGNDDGACGSGGALCNTCGPGTACVANVCVAPKQVASLGGGNGLTCALRGDRSLWCWGLDIRGQLGVGSMDNVPHLSPAVLTGTWAQVARSSGSLHACAIATDHSLWCWGENANGQLGLGDEGAGTERLVPTQVGTDNDWKQATTGQDHSCGLKLDGSVWCWGSNGVYQAGVANPANVTTPTKVVSSGAVQISAGISATCMVVTDGSLSCWGFGLMWLPMSSTPSAPFSSYDQWTSVSMGGDHMCGLRHGGEVWCWGDNTYGEVGLAPSMTPLVRPTRVGTDNDWTDVTAGSDFSCGRRKNGRVYCWGRDDQYRLGTGDDPPIHRSQPTPVGAATDWASSIAYTGHGCGTKQDGQVWCWGDNGMGDVGTGLDSNPRPSPVAVALP